MPVATSRVASDYAEDFNGSSLAALGCLHGEQPGGVRRGGCSHVSVSNASCGFSLAIRPTAAAGCTAIDDFVSGGLQL